MGNALAALGRSGFNPVQTMRGFSAFEESQARVKRMEREEALAKQEAERRGRMLDVRATADSKLPGGVDGAYGKAFIEVAKQEGRIDPSTGDLGSISQGDAEELWKRLDEHPTWAAKIHGEHLHELHQRRKSLTSALTEKPNDKNIKEQLEKTNIDIQQATEIMPGIKAEVKRQAEAKQREVEYRQKLEIEETKANARATAAKKVATAKIKADKIKALALRKWRNQLLAKDKDKANKKGEKSAPLYTISQRIDDARQYYSLLMRSMIDNLGGIIEGKEEEYNTLMADLSEDINLIRQEEKPTYLGGKAREVVRYGTIKSGPNKGRKVVEYDDGSTDFAD